MQVSLSGVCDQMISVRAKKEVFFSTQLCHFTQPLDVAGISVLLPEVHEGRIFEKKQLRKKGIKLESHKHSFKNP